MGRTRIDIDEKKVLRLAKLGATNTDIAYVVGCSENVIRARFGEIVAKGRATRRNSLRRWQWKAASEGNIAMMIWLGKQYLDQSEKSEVKGEVTTVVHAQKQRAMLRSEKAFDLASDLEREIIHAGPSAYDAASRDDPGGIRPSGQ